MFLKFLSIALLVCSASACAEKPIDPQIVGSWACKDNDTQGVSVSIIFREDKTAHIDWKWAGMTPTGQDSEVRYYADITYALTRTDKVKLAITSQTMNANLGLLTYDGKMADVKEYSKTQKKIRNDLSGAGISYFLYPQEDRNTDLGLALGIGSSLSSISCKRDLDNKTAP